MRLVIRRSYGLDNDSPLDYSLLCGEYSGPAAGLSDTALAAMVCIAGADELDDALALADSIRDCLDGYPSDDRD